MTGRRSGDVLRRWRWVIMAGAVIGIVVGWVSAPAATRPTTTFQATHTLSLVRQVAGGPESLRVNVVLATLGAVPDRVAGRLGIKPQQVRSMVSAEPGAGGSLLITARSPDRAQAEALANVTAEELVVELGGKTSPLQTLEPAVASPIEDDQIRGPTSRLGRAAFLGGFGLLLGIGAAIALDRFDTRIRSKASAEEALGVPVMAEVPALPRSDQGRTLTEAQPSAFIEAYRGLRTSVDRWTGQTADDGHRQVIVVTSATGGEGATTTVAHLAATFGEIGRSVLVISADLRRPRLHLYFDRAREPGLTDVLRGAPDARRLTDLNLATTARGVRFVSSGAPVRNPAPLLDRIGDYLPEARELGEIVLIDAPPLLTTSDGAELARHADGVLLVARAGRTSVGAAARSVELLQRLNIPVLGAVLVAAGGAAGRT